MFTGIITGVGRIVASHDLGSSLHHGKRLTISCPPTYTDDVGLADSIALNGACMTVTTLTPAQHQFTIDISAESMNTRVRQFQRDAGARPAHRGPNSGARHFLTRFDTTIRCSLP